MLNRDQAKEKAATELTKVGEPVVILDAATLELDFGWVFFYQSSEFIRTGAVSDMLAGNVPVIVNRYSGEVFSTGSALPIKNYIENYRSRIRCI